MLNKLLLALLIFVHVFILTKLAFFPYSELFVYPFLTNHGLKPYSEILDQHFPGLMFLPINFDNLGMNNEIIARIWLIVSVIITHLLLFFISCAVLKDKRKALLTNFLFLLWQPFFEGWVLWIDSFLALLLLPAFFFLYKRKIFLSGLLLGIGIIFKQTLIPLSFLTLIYIFWSGRSVKSVYMFLLGLLMPMIPVVLYLISIRVIGDFWYWTIIFNLTTYAKYGTSAPATIGFVTRVLFVYSFSLFAVFNKDKRLVQTLFLFLLGSLIGIFDRADFVHFQPSLPFAVLATSLGIYQLSRKNIFLILILIYVFIALWWLNIFYKGNISSKVFFFDPQTKLISQKIRQYTNISEKIFIFGAPPNLYQMADRLPAGNIFVFQFPWFLKVAQGRVLQGLVEDKPNIIVADREAKVQGVKITDFASDIDKYIQQNYEVFDHVGTINILRRKTF